MQPTKCRSVPQCAHRRQQALDGKSDCGIRWLSFDLNMLPAQACAQRLALLTHRKVRWPALFVGFIDMIDRFTIEAFSIVPAECIVGQRLGFYYELVATLLLPILTFLLILLMAFVVYSVELWQVRRAKCANAFSC